MRAGRQVVDARDGLRIHQPEPAPRRLPQPVGPRPHPRRQQRRKRRRARHRHGLRGRRRRYRRFKPTARGALRHRRRQGHLWTRQPSRRHPAELVDGYRRPHGPHRRRCGRDVTGHGRFRPQGSDHPTRCRARLPRRADRRHEGAADRRAARPLHGHDGARRRRPRSRTPSAC